jgi:hypothetical protein
VIQITEAELQSMATTEDFSAIVVAMFARGGESIS